MTPCPCTDGHDWEAEPPSDDWPYADALVCSACGARSRECPDCAGTGMSGYFDADGTGDCETCGGTGTFYPFKTRPNEEPPR